jgi:hypothetical protein
VRDCCETQYCPDTIHFFEIPDDRPIIFFLVFFEKKKGQQLMLSEIPSQIFTGIRGDSRGLYYGKCMLDKTDKPTRRFLNCLLMGY